MNPTKYCVIVLTAVLALNLLGHHQTASNYDQRRLKVIAHRGASGKYPELTLLSLGKALEDGADILEVDIRASSDGELVSIHDPTLERTTNGKGSVASYTLDELKSLDAGYNFSPDGSTYPWRGKGLTIPTLVEILDAFPRAYFILDVKISDRELLVDMVSTLRSMGMENRVTIFSHTNRTIVKIRQMAPELEVAASPREIGAVYLASRLLGARWLQPGFRVIHAPMYVRFVNVCTPRFVRAAQDMDVEVWVWTVNEPQAIRKALEMGVDGIVTGFPCRAMSTARELGLR